MRAITSVIGAGTMGQRMVERLIAQGHHVQVHDPDAAASAEARQLGASVFTAAADAVAGAQVCILSLPTPSVVAEVTDESGLLGSGQLPQVVVDTSTVDPETTRAAASRMRQRGIGYLDAPVLGRPDKCGNWTLPIGGAPDDVEQARATLDVLASKLVHVGSVGTGNAVKLLNNLMFAAINAVTAECLAGASRVGLDPEIFVSTVAESGAASVSNLFLEIGPKIVAADFSPAFTVELLHKDVDLAGHMLQEAGASPVLGPVLLGLTERALQAGLGSLDTSAISQLFPTTESEES